MSDPVFDLLLRTLLERLAVSGFETPKDLSEKRQLSWVIETLEQATILPSEDFTRLVEAGREVVNSWEHGDLANAVRTLDRALPAGQEKKI